MGPKEKKERSLGERLQLKATRCQSPKCAAVRKPYRPGAHGRTGRVRALSDFGRQIKEKQKFKYTYGINERNLKHLFESASKKTGSTGSRLIELLELRLDNVIFRMGLAPSRAMARQAVLHGHIMVNKKKVRAPGYVTRTGDEVTIRPESAGKAAFKDLKESLKKYEAPAWIHVDPEKLVGKVIGNPETSVVPFEVNLVVESFSK
ncbi:MAG: 30S ribosomal protein S4 [Candidatus Liptonbacteria bacterium]